MLAKWASMTWRIVAAGWLTAGLVGGCVSTGDQSTADTITDSLTAAAASTSRTVEVAKAVDGNWTRLLFVCSYTDRASVEDRLGFAWPDFRSTDQDGENIWVFATDRKIVSWAIIPGYHADPCYYSGARPPDTVARADATFRVEDTGERVLDNVPYRALRPLR